MLGGLEPATCCSNEQRRKKPTDLSATEDLLSLHSKSPVVKVGGQTDGRTDTTRLYGDALIRLSTPGTAHPRFDPPIHALNPISLLRSAYPRLEPHIHAAIYLRIRGRPYACLHPPTHAKMHEKRNAQPVTTGARTRHSRAVGRVLYPLDHAATKKEKKCLPLGRFEPTTCCSFERRRYRLGHRGLGEPIHAWNRASTLRSACPRLEPHIHALIRLSTLETLYPRFDPPIHAWNRASTL